MTLQNLFSETPMNSRVKKWAQVAGLALALRAFIVVMHGYFRDVLFFVDISLLLVFGWPLLNVAVLLIASLPGTDRIFRIARFVLPALVINAAWRIYEYFAMYDDCEVTAGGRHEFICESVGMQFFFLLPFLALWVIYVAFHLYKRWRLSLVNKPSYEG